MGLAPKIGQTVLVTQGSGQAIRHRVMASSGISMGISLKVIGKMIKQMEKGLTRIRMEQTMRVIGKMTYSMVRVMRHGSTAQATPESTTPVANKVRGRISGRTVVPTQVSGSTTTSLDMVHTPGSMDADI
jgi:hypothetical protein